MLLFEYGLAGLWGGKLCGPSMLRDIIEFRLLFVLSTESSPPSISPPIEHVILLVVAFAGALPGVMEDEYFGDDGTLAIVGRLWNKQFSNFSEIVQKSGNSIVNPP